MQSTVGWWAVIMTVGCVDGGEPSGVIDETTVTYGDYVDNDGDGSKEGIDCDDNDPTVKPNADELCDGLDNDCDGAIDEEPEPDDGFEFYVDFDNDGFGTPGKPQIACEAPPGYADNDDDCDDNAPELHPDTVWYRDLDDDGYGTDEVVDIICVAPFQSALLTGDCDDDDPEINPGAIEVCDAIDNNCNGTWDEDAPDAQAWFADTDGDGFGDPDSAIYECWRPEDYIDNGWDCDDTDETFHPGAPEDCDDSLDHDCSGRPDNGCNGTTIGSADVSFRAEAQYDYLGYQVAAIDDMNGDGRQELAMGAYYNDHNATYSGAVYIKYGSEDTGSFNNVANNVDAIIYGDSYYDALGYNVQSAGDVNDDGIGDLLVGGYNSDYYSCYLCGEATLYYGPISGELSPLDADASVTTTTNYSYFGDTSSVGDTNGDGIDDLVVGGSRTPATKGATYSYDGVMYFYEGPVASLDPKSAVGSFAGDPGSYAGIGLSDLKDHNGDGFGDVAIGAYDHANEGAVFVLNGPISGDHTPKTADVTYSAELADDYLGYRVEWGGDINNDGHEDLIATARYNDEGGSNAGAVYVVYGPLSADMNIRYANDAKLYGNGSSLQFGSGLDGGADFDGDGYDDVLVGDMYNDGSGSNGGAAFVFYGPLTGPRKHNSADYIVSNPGSSDYLGNDVAYIEYDGDGIIDLALGSYYYDYYGRAFVHFGAGL